MIANHAFDVNAKKPFFQTNSSNGGIAQHWIMDLIIDMEVSK